jgi:hypothetical protein
MCSCSLGRLILRRWRGLPSPRWGNVRRLAPFSRIFGFDRGQSIDRYYIENFLKKHEMDIRGTVLEIGDPGYTSRFGGDRVTHSDVLHVSLDNPRATIVGDLATGEGIPEAAFDCMIITQTYQMIYDVKSSASWTYSSLKPGGVLLATLPGISQISRYDMDRWGDYWRFTDASARRLFGDVFEEKNVTIETYGNVLTAVAFLHGLSVEELRQKELSCHDPDYQLLITVRAVKPKAAP